MVILNLYNPIILHMRHSLSTKSSRPTFSENLRNIGREWRSKTSKAGIDFHADIPSQLKCEANLQQVTETVNHLIDIHHNALAANPSSALKHPRVDLNVTDEGDQIAISVSNNLAVLDAQSADIASDPGDQDFLFEFDSNVGNRLTVCYPTGVTLHQKAADQLRAFFRANRSVKEQKPQLEAANV